MCSNDVDNRQGNNNVSTLSLSMATWNLAICLDNVFFLQECHQWGEELVSMG